jgi:hypothetical protein
LLDVADNAELNGGSLADTLRFAGAYRSEKDDQG